MLQLLQQQLYLETADKTFFTEKKDETNMKFLLTLSGLNIMGCFFLSSGIRKIENFFTVTLAPLRTGNPVRFSSCVLLPI
jgi:hypothetical protein